VLTRLLHVAWSADATFSLDWEGGGSNTVCFTHG
jgi:hypothetical protein